MLGQQAGDGGLAGARIAAEHQVQAGVEDGQVLHLPELLYLQQVGQLSDGGLHLLQPDQRVEIRQELLERWWLVLGPSSGGGSAGGRPNPARSSGAEQGGAESIDGVLAVARVRVDGGRLRATPSARWK